MQCRNLLLAVLGCMLLGTAPVFTQCIDDCLRPSSVARPFQSLSDVELSGRCLTECAVMVVGTDHKSVVRSYGLQSVAERILGGSARYFKHKECTLGCRVAPSSDTSRDCRNTCLDICQNCNDPIRPLFLVGCFALNFCTKFRCGVGCTLYSEKFDNEDNTSLTIPPPPISFTASRLDNGEAGNFEITASFNTSTTPTSNDDIYAFIFKMENENETLYVLQSSLTEALDLSYFSCQEVNVSLAVLNRNGSSSFTSPTPLCVHGAPPSAARNFTVASIVDDTRPGFYGHAVIGLEWDLPEGFPELTGYQLVMVPSPPLGHFVFCGSVQTFQIDKNVTSYTVMASVPNETLRFEVDRNLTCVYRFTLKSLPGENQVFREINFQKELTTDPVPPTVNVTCSSSADRDTGLHNIRMEFTYTNISLITEAIYNYSVVLLIENQINAADILTPRVPLEEIGVLSGVLVKRTERLFNCGHETAPYTIGLTETGETIAGFFSASDFCPQEDDSTLYLNLRFTLDVKNGPWWRPLPMFQECSVVTDIVLPGPVLPESISLQDSQPSYTLGSDGRRILDNFTISWSPPEDPYGEIVSYAVYVGPRLLEGSETSGFRDRRTNGNETIITISDYIIPSNPPLPVCLFLQIRYDGRFAQSDWSEPFYIPIEDNYSPAECTFTLSPDDGSNDSNNGVSTIFRTGVIAEAAIIFGLLLLLVVICTFVCFKPRCCRKHKSNYYWQAKSMDSSPGHHTHHSTAPEDEDDKAPVGNGWEIPIEYIVHEYQLGEGSFGTVAKGYIHGPVPGTYTMKNRIHAVVAIKFLKDGPTEQEKLDFSNEILLMKRIGFAKHPNVVGLFGCVTVSEPVCILLEYLEYGDLLTYLEDIRQEVENLSQQNAGVQVSVVTLPTSSMYANLGDLEPDNLLSFAYQIASGMEFLGGLDIIHRDLACRNILVGDKKILKISDFGLSREGDVYVKTTGGKMPYRWMAVESLKDREFTVQSDVWAYGVVLWEIATLGMFPYATIANEDILDHIVEGNRLEKPPNCSNEVYEQMLLCWKVQPKERPAFSGLKDRFESLLLETSNYLQFTTISSPWCSDEVNVPGPAANQTPQNHQPGVVADIYLPLSNGSTEIIVDLPKSSTDATTTLPNVTSDGNGKYISAEKETNV